MTSSTATWTIFYNIYILIFSSFLFSNPRPAIGHIYGCKEMLVLFTNFLVYFSILSSWLWIFFYFDFLYKFMRVYSRIGYCGWCMSQFIERISSYLCLSYFLNNSFLVQKNIKFINKIISFLLWGAQ